MIRKSFNIGAEFQGMFFEIRRPPGTEWHLQLKDQPDRTRMPVMRNNQLDDIAKDIYSKPEKEFKQPRKKFKFVTENPADSGQSSGGYPSGIRETSTRPRVRHAPTKKHLDPIKENNVEWLDKLSSKSFKIAADSADGLWGIYDGRVYVTAAPIGHTVWFGDIGLPDHGEAFDRITRGYFIIEDNVMKLAVYINYGNEAEFEDYQNRLLDKIGHEDIYEGIEVIRNSYLRPSMERESSESSMLIPYRDLDDGFHRTKLKTPGDGHRPFMRNKQPGEGLSKIPIYDLPTKPFFETSPKVLKRFKKRIKSFNIRANFAVGKWAIYKGKLYVESGKKLHALWFEELGLPSWGEDFDAVPRGWYEYEDGYLSLVVYEFQFDDSLNVLFSNEKPLVDRIKGIENIPLIEPNKVQIYTFDDVSRKRVASKSFDIKAYYPKNPKTVIIPKNEYYNRPIDENKLWTYYDKVKSKIIPQTKGKHVLIWIRTDGDILKRKNDGFINIDNTNDFNRLNNGRMVEVHPEIAYQKGEQWYSDVIFCDLDPQKKFDWNETKELAKEIYDIFRRDTNVKKATINFSGNRGFHIVGKLRTSWEVDKARNYTKKVLKPLETDKIKLGLVKEKNMLRMDTTLLKKRGSLRAAYSLHKETGLVAVPVDVKSLYKFEKKHATIDKVAKSFGKKSFKLASPTLEQAYKPLYKKYIGQLISDHKEEILRDASQLWLGRGLSKEDIVPKWDQLSDTLDRVNKEQFIALFLSYKRQLGKLSSSGTEGSNPEPYYGDTNTYPYKGTGPAMGSSSQLDLILDTQQMKDTQVNNRELTRVSKTVMANGMSFSDKSLKKSLDELDPDEALKWIGMAGGKVKLMTLLNNLAENFGVSISDKAKKVIDEGYRRWKEIPSSRVTGIKKSFKLVAHETATVQTSNIPEDVTSYIKELQSTIAQEVLCDKEDEEGWIANGLQQLFHITILYGIKDEDFDAVKNIFESFSGPIDIEVKDLTHFDNEDNGYSVAVLECESNKLKELHNTLSDTIPNKHAYDFTPHITVAYLNLGERLELPEGGFGKVPLRWDIGDIELSKTDDSICKIEKKSFKITSYIKKLPGKDKWRVHSESGKNMGTYNSLKEAKARLKQIEFFKHKKSFKLSARFLTFDDIREFSRQQAYAETGELLEGDTLREWSTNKLNEIVDEQDRIFKSFKIDSNKPGVSDDVYDAFTEKGYAFKNYQLSDLQINEAIDHGKDLSLLLKHQKLTDKQRDKAINKSLDKKIALVYIYEKEKEHLSEAQYSTLIDALYEKAAADGTNLQYVLKNFDLDPKKKDVLIMKGLQEGIALHFMFKQGLLNADQREFAVKKAIETGYGLLDLLKYERLSPEQKEKIIAKAIERGVALVYMLRKESLNEEQKTAIFKKAIEEGKGYHYLLRQYKLKPEQVEQAIQRSKHSIDNLDYIRRFQDISPEQKSYVDDKIDKLKEQRKDRKEEELEKMRQSNKKLFVVPGADGYQELREFFRDANSSDVSTMHGLIRKKDFAEAKAFLGGWNGN